MARRGSERRMDVLLQELRQVLAEIDQREGRSNRSRPYNPASESAIASAERRLQIEFPPSYREFLRLHNGWDGFNAGDICVLGVSGSAYERALAQWKADLIMFEKSFRRRGPNYVQELRKKSRGDNNVIHIPDHVPFATNYNGDWWVFDKNLKKADGEYEIARVAHGEDVEDREESFLAFVNANLRRKQTQLGKLGSTSQDSGSRQGTAAAVKSGRERGRASGARGSKSTGRKPGKPGKSRTASSDRKKV
jgi:hypothetical protein